MGTSRRSHSGRKILFSCYLTKQTHCMSTGCRWATPATGSSHRSERSRIFRAYVTSSYVNRGRAYGAPNVLCAVDVHMPAYTDLPCLHIQTHVRICVLSTMSSYTDILVAYVYIIYGLTRKRIIFFLSSRRGNFADTWWLCFQSLECFSACTILHGLLVLKALSRDLLLTHIFGC